jgi:hypothetical protein
MDSKKRTFVPLSSTHPEIASQAFGWNPDLVSRGSRKKLAWKCDLGHVWDAQPNDRTGARSGCPVCANRIVLAGFNDLATTNPEIAAQAHGWDPQKVMGGSSVNLEWVCKKGHIWRSTPVSRVRQTTGCLVCLGKQVTQGFNDLVTTHPEIAIQAHGWDPTKVIAGSNKRLLWKCNLGHEWRAQPNSRTGSQSGCPVCSNLQIEIGYNDLTTTHPKIAFEAYGWDPQTVVAGSNKAVMWRCQFGHIWKSQVISRTLQKSGCLVCINKILQSGVNDLATTHPEIAAEADGWDPKKVMAGSEKKLIWKCPKSHTYKSSVKSRSARKTSCPICSGNKVLTGFNDLKTTHPELSAQSVDWNPEDYIAGSHANKLWQCNLGHQWIAQIKSRALTGNNCPFCANVRVLIGFNDLVTTHPRLAKESYGWDPSTVIAGSTLKKKWICEEKHIWVASINSRTNRSSRGGSGCPSCANSGFDPNSEGWLYFLRHPQWQMLQIGITNFPDDRLKNHKKLGWKLIELRGPMDGLIAREWETSILQMLKAHGADLSNKEIAGKFDGYSEAWSESTFLAKSLRKLMNMVEENE